MLSRHLLAGRQRAVAACRSDPVSDSLPLKGLLQHVVYGFNVVISPSAAADGTVVTHQPMQTFVKICMELRKACGQQARLLPKLFDGVVKRYQVVM